MRGSKQSDVQQAVSVVAPVRTTRARRAAGTLACVLALCGASVQAQTPTKVRFVLDWVVQGQSAHFFNTLVRVVTICFFSSPPLSPPGPAAPSPGFALAAPGFVAIAAMFE